VQSLARGAAALALAAGLATVGACGADTTAGKAEGSGTPPTDTTAASSSATEKCGVEGDTGCAPTSERVDLAEPTFSDPISITNPLFQVNDLTQVIQLGEEAGEPVRNEITLLPRTKTIEWNGQDVETLVRQYIAYGNGRILEVALDYFAQADDGSVWYFGESVDNYEDGVIADHEGTWLAGKDGPPGMIMPADPQVGDVYRPENIPGLVFEEVTVKRTDLTVRGPRGPVDGAILVEEHLMEGTVEQKVFAPDYREFRIRAADELGTVALALPIDAPGGPVPVELTTLSTGAVDIFDAAPSQGWEDISATLDTVTAAWDVYQAGDVPPLLETQMTGALDALAAAVDARNPADARQAALDVTQAALDFRLQHRPVAEVDFARLDLWSRQLLVDAAADDPGGVASDVAILETIWKRVGHTVDASDAARIDAQLADLRAAADAEDLAAATDAAERMVLRDRV
jgi:hypothetical protein